MSAIVTWHYYAVQLNAWNRVQHNILRTNHKCSYFINNWCLIHTTIFLQELECIARVTNVADDCPIYFSQPTINNYCDVVNNSDVSFIALFFGSKMSWVSAAIKLHYLDFLFHKQTALYRLAIYVETRPAVSTQFETTMLDRKFQLESFRCKWWNNCNRKQRCRKRLYVTKRLTVVDWMLAGGLADFFACFDNVTFALVVVVRGR